MKLYGDKKEYTVLPSDVTIEETIDIMDGAHCIEYGGRPSVIWVRDGAGGGKLMEKREVESVIKKVESKSYPILNPNILMYEQCKAAIKLIELIE